MIYIYIYIYIYVIYMMYHTYIYIYISHTHIYIYTYHIDVSYVHHIHHTSLHILELRYAHFLFLSMIFCDQSLKEIVFAKNTRNGSVWKSSSCKPTALDPFSNWIWYEFDWYMIDMIDMKDMIDIWYMIIDFIRQTLFRRWKGD